MQLRECRRRNEGGTEVGYLQLAQHVWSPAGTWPKRQVGLQLRLWERHHPIGPHQQAEEWQLLPALDELVGGTGPTGPLSGRTPRSSARSVGWGSNATSAWCGTPTAREVISGP